MAEGRTASTRPRLRVRAAVFCLAREMWLREHDPYASSGDNYWDNAWDEDSLLSDVYERYIAKAEATIRTEMD